MKCDYYRLEPDGLIDKVTFWMWNELLYKPKIYITFIRYLLHSLEIIELQADDPQILL